MSVRFHTLFFFDGGFTNVHNGDKLDCTKPMPVA